MSLLLLSVCILYFIVRIYIYVDYITCICIAHLLSSTSSYFSNYRYIYMRRILDIHWSNCVTNAVVLTHAQLSSIYALLQQCQLHWLGHVQCMLDRRILKVILYRELGTSKRVQGQPQLHFKDIFKSDLRAMDRDTKMWEGIAYNCSCWRHH